MLQTMGQWAVNGVLASFAVMLVREICVSFSPTIKSGKIFFIRQWTWMGLWGGIFGAALGALWAIST